MDGRVDRIWLASYAEVRFCIHIDGWMDDLLLRHDCLSIYFDDLLLYQPISMGICTSYEYMGDGEIFFPFQKEGEKETGCDTRDH